MEYIPEVPAAPTWNASGVTGNYHPSSSDLSAFWGGDSYFQSPASSSNALGISAFWCGAAIISEAMAMMPLEVWQERKSGGWDKRSDHPSNYMLNTSINGWLVPSHWKSLNQLAMIMGGNGINKITRNGRGQAIRLDFISQPNYRVYLREHNDPTYALRDYPLVENSHIIQMSPGQNISWEEYPFEDVLHLKAFGSDAYFGLSTLSIARKGINLTTAIETFGQRYYNKGRPAGFLTKPGRIGDDERKILRDEWKELYEGESAFNVGILSGGMDWKALGFTNDDAQFLQSREFQVLEFARWLRIPPHMLGEVSKATNSNIETLMLEFITFTLLPWIVRWEEELNQKIFTPREQSMGFKCFFDVDAFLRGDSKTRVTVDESDIRNGIRTIEEVRLARRLNPYPDGLGSEPLAMASQLDSLRRIVDGTSLLQGYVDPATKKEPVQNGK